MVIFGWLPACGVGLAVNGERNCDRDGDTLNCRREIAGRVLAKWKASGFTLEAVPDWMSLVDLWIDGAIDGAEMHRRYLAALKAQAGARQKQAAHETPDRTG